jgi:hypothetical protein
MERFHADWKNCGFAPLCWFSGVALTLSLAVVTILV